MRCQGLFNYTQVAFFRAFTSQEKKDTFFTGSQAEDGSLHTDATSGMAIGFEIACMTSRMLLYLNSRIDGKPSSLILMKILFFSMRARLNTHPFRTETMEAPVFSQASKRVKKMRPARAHYGKD
jgi:hypothetical protein